MTKPLAIIAVDPGKKTGVAEWLQDVAMSNNGEQFNSYEFDVEQFYDFIHQRIRNLAAAGYDVRLVSESFIITINTAKNTQSTWSLEMVGILKFLCHRYNLEALKLQAPSVGKTFGTNGKLKYLEWYRTGTIDGVRYAGHANDAARHLATYAAQRGLLFTMEQLIAMAEL